MQKYRADISETQADGAGLCDPCHEIGLRFDPS